MLEVEADPRTGPNGVWGPYSETALLPSVTLKPHPTKALLPISSLN